MLERHQNSFVSLKHEKENCGNNKCVLRVIETDFRVITANIRLRNSERKTEKHDNCSNTKCLLCVMQADITKWWEEFQMLNMIHQGKFMKRCPFPCSFHIWHYASSVKCEMNMEMYTFQDPAVEKCVYLILEAPADYWQRPLTLRRNLRRYKKRGVIDRITPMSIHFPIIPARIPLATLRTPWSTSNDIDKRSNV